MKKSTFHQLKLTSIITLFKYHWIFHYTSPALNPVPCKQWGCRRPKLIDITCSSGHTIVWGFLSCFYIALSSFMYYMIELFLHCSFFI